MISIIQAYTLAEVNKHNSEASCWVIYRSKVYDVTEFAIDHPGGNDLILGYGGKDITDIFHDTLSHPHSENAVEILDEFLVGEVRSEGGGRDSFAHKGNYTLTNAKKDLAEEKFLDLSKPLLEQMFFNNFKKDFYLKQVHKPRYTKESPNFMSSPYLELLTRTAWYVVPIFWIPISCTFLYFALENSPYPSTVWQIYVFGIFLFSLIEYIFHRFLFHLDDMLPDMPMFLFLHFMLHGVHHYIPMDRMRLVLPPVLAVFFFLPLMKLAYFLLANNIPAANALLAGGLVGYMCYDLMHYYVHHGHILFEYFREMKSYHMSHHHSNYEVGFGITSKIWDYAFNTLLTKDSPNILEERSN